MCTYSVLGNNNYYSECSDKRMNEKCSDWQEESYSITCPEEIRSPHSGGCWEFGLDKQKLIDYGPLAVCYVHNGYFESGIYKCENESIYDMHHCALVVGYNDTEQYWVVKNSWGKNYHPDNYDKGYFKVGYGECNIDNSWYAWASIPSDYVPETLCGSLITEDLTLTENLLDCNGDALLVGADNITIDCQGYKIYGKNNEDTAGIRVNEKTGVTIKNCVIGKFGEGISLRNSEHITLENNRISDFFGDKNTNGIVFKGGKNNLITNNQIKYNEDNGIIFESSFYNQINNNDISHNSKGINLLESGYNLLNNNIIQQNSELGIKLNESKNNEINENFICTNNWDISCYLHHGNEGNPATGFGNILKTNWHCPDISYELCGCDSNVCGVEGDLNEGTCLSINCKNTSWGLGTGDSLSTPCWTDLCCGDDQGEFLVHSTISGWQSCCNSPNDCVDGTGSCQNEINGEETCGDNQDNDCDGLIDCDDSDCGDICTNCSPPCSSDKHCIGGECVYLQTCWWNNDCPENCYCERPYCQCETPS